MSYKETFYKAAITAGEISAVAAKAVVEFARGAIPPAALATQQFFKEASQGLPAYVAEEYPETEMRVPALLAAFKRGTNTYGDDQYEGFGDYVYIPQYPVEEADGDSTLLGNKDLTLIKTKAPAAPQEPVSFKTVHFAGWTP